MPSCSSLANVSLAFLGWATVSQMARHRNSTCDLLWCSLACASVIAVNVARVSILGLSQWHYATFHNQLGEVVANIITLILIVGISALGVRHELFQRA
jgi:exosortase/archaeosortase family protein